MPNRVLNTFIETEAASHAAFHRVTISSTPGKELGLGLNGCKQQVLVVKLFYKPSIHSCSYYTAPALNHHLKECNLFLIFDFLIFPQQNKFRTRAWKLWGRRNIFPSYFPVNWDTEVAALTQSQVESAFGVSHPSGNASDMGPFILLSPWKCNHCAPQYSAMSFKDRDINLNTN